MASAPQPDAPPPAAKAKAAGVAAETMAFVAVEEVASNFDAGAETVITGVGGSMIGDFASGDLKSAAVKAAAIVGTVIVRRLLFNRKTLSRLTNAAGRLLAAAVESLSRKRR